MASRTLRTVRWPLDFNLTHSGGIDIELIWPIETGIAEGFFSAAENSKRRTGPTWKERVSLARVAGHDTRSCYP
jgi:hypothetical protein